VALHKTTHIIIRPLVPARPATQDRPSHRHRHTPNPPPLSTPLEPLLCRVAAPQAARDLVHPLLPSRPQLVPLIQISPESTLRFFLALFLFLTLAVDSSAEAVEHAQSGLCRAAVDSNRRKTWGAVHRDHPPYARPTPPTLVGWYTPYLWAAPASFQSLLDLPWLYRAGLFCWSGIDPVLSPPVFGSYVGLCNHACLHQDMQISASLC